NVFFYKNLSLPEQQKLRDDLRILIAEKYWEGCQGFVVTEEVQVTIAAQAAMLVLGMENQYFDHVKSILVYPTAYIASEKTMGLGGVVTVGNSAREGEAWYRGPIILSWDDVLQGGRRDSDGYNLVFHEFAHQLDMLNGRSTDGTPLMESKQQYEQWQTVLNSEYNQLVKACQTRSRRTLLDCYGATNLAEFFAVATECFFERALQLKKKHPALYDILSGYYHQDPASDSRS
ncbi:MAG: zinc-dependent peptidase, partial [Planctomycetaceae bacterium]|nr:zinc-dependent peptidase [Planctomycetaceae bacterium]